MKFWWTSLDNSDLRPDLSYDRFKVAMTKNKLVKRKVGMPGTSIPHGISSQNQSGTTFSGYTRGSTPMGSFGIIKYPNLIMHGDWPDADYINAMVSDIQAKADLIAGLEDKIKALQERVELLEDDVNDS